MAQALPAAPVAKVAPSIVKIETSGGREMATGGGTRLRPGMPAPVGGGAVGRADDKPDHGRADAVDHIDDGA